jgi:hypothetical protein
MPDRTAPSLTAHSYPRIDAWYLSPETPFGQWSYSADRIAQNPAKHALTQCRWLPIDWAAGGWAQPVPGTDESIGPSTVNTRAHLHSSLQEYDQCL